MADNLEGRASEPKPRVLDEETLAKIEETRKEFAEKSRHYSDAIRAGQRDINRNYRVNC